jgi:ribulose-5-phosphate 4-epimerase/fuculose-1-phosphate aldolase
MSELDDVKRATAIANRVLAAVGLASGSQVSVGHASMRVPGTPDRFVVKGRGYAYDALERMRPEDMVECDLEGYKVGGPERATQCFEVKMHSCIYRARPDVQSVVHVHPPYTVTMSVLGARIVPMCISGLKLVRHPLPVYPHVKVVQSDEEGSEVARLLGDGPAILLFGHGATTVGRRVEESVMNMIWLEQQAHMNWLATCAAGPDHPRIPDELADEHINVPDLNTYPHLAMHFKGSANQVRDPNVGGAWQAYKHFAELVSRDL